MKKFGQSFEQGREYIQELSKGKKPVIRKVLKDVIANFKEVEDMELPHVREERPLYFFQKYCVRAIQKAIEEGRNVVADFICPTDQTRTDFNADYIIWMDTIKEGRFKDTNKMFVPPTNYDFKVTHLDADMWVFLIKQDIQERFND